MSELRYLLDTNICIYVAKRRPPAVARRFAKLPAGSVGMSTITYGELRFGAEKSERRTQSLDILRGFAEIVPVIALTPVVGETYGRLRAELERAGKPIGNNDLWIAAHALALGVVLVTNNTREFKRVSGLAVENWAS